MGGYSDGGAEIFFIDALTALSNSNIEQYAIVNKKNKSREAHFVCSLSIKFNDKKIISAVGKVKGSIANKIKGTNGFGYDAIFIPSGKKITYAQMSKKKKTKIDHRFIAFQKLKKSLKIL